METSTRFRRADGDKPLGELGETVEALSHKADVKERVRENAFPLAAVAGGIVALLLLLRLIRRR